MKIIFEDYNKEEYKLEEEHPAFPRWQWRIEWDCNGLHDEGHEDGDSGNYTKMLKLGEPCDLETMTNMALDSFYVKHPAILEARVSRMPDGYDMETYFDGLVIKKLYLTRLVDEEWILTWFEHSTWEDYENPRTPEQLRSSFRDFVSRMNRRDWHKDYDAESSEGKYMSMGADETWRWTGPCDCEHCVKLGVARIGH